jgi:hypothetical protein
MSSFPTTAAKKIDNETELAKLANDSEPSQPLKMNSLSLQTVVVYPVWKVVSNRS